MGRHDLAPEMTPAYTCTPSSLRGVFVACVLASTGCFSPGPGPAQLSDTDDATETAGETENGSSGEAEESTDGGESEPDPSTDGDEGSSEATSDGAAPPGAPVCSANFDPSSFDPCGGVLAGNWQLEALCGAWTETSELALFGDDLDCGGSTLTYATDFNRLSLAILEWEPGNYNLEIEFSDTVVVDAPLGCAVSRSVQPDPAVACSELGTTALEQPTCHVAGDRCVCTETVPYYVYTEGTSVNSEGQVELTDALSGETLTGWYCGGEEQLALYLPEFDLEGYWLLSKR